MRCPRPFWTCPFPSGRPFSGSASPTLLSATTRMPAGQYPATLSLACEKCRTYAILFSSQILQSLCTCVTMYRYSKLVCATMHAPWTVTNPHPHSVVSWLLLQVLDLLAGAVLPDQHAIQCLRHDTWLLMQVLDLLAGAVLDQHGVQRAVQRLCSSGAGSHCRLHCGSALHLCSRLFWRHHACTQ